MAPEVNVSHHRAWQERRRRASPSIQQISGCSLIWCFDDCRLTVQSQIPSRCSVVFWWIQRPEHMIHHVHTQWAWPASVSSQGKGDHQERLCIDLQWPPQNRIDIKSHHNTTEPPYVLFLHQVIQVSPLNFSPCCIFWKRDRRGILI